MSETSSTQLKVVPEGTEARADIEAIRRKPIRELTPEEAKLRDEEIDRERKIATRSRNLLLMWAKREYKSGVATDAVKNILHGYAERFNELREAQGNKDQEGIDFAKGLIESYDVSLAQEYIKATGDDLFKQED